MGIISWDFALNEKAEPVLIEFNVKPQGIDLRSVKTDLCSVI